MSYRDLFDNQYGCSHSFSSTCISLYCSRWEVRFIPLRRLIVRCRFQLKLDSQHSVIDFSSEIVINLSHEMFTERIFIRNLINTRRTFLSLSFSLPSSCSTIVLSNEIADISNGNHRTTCWDTKWPSVVIDIFGQSNYMDREWHRQLSDITIKNDLSTVNLKAREKMAQSFFFL